MAKPPLGGYNGKILRVNLSDKSIKAEPLSYEICRRYIGGAGFIAYYLWKELKQGVDALSPDNKLIFATGPVSGVSLPGAARNCIGAKSPLTGGIAKSETGGFWPAEFKRAGYDAIIIEGKAEKPVYLWIQDGEVAVKDAQHLWGKETKDTELAIRAELGDDKIQVAMIGPAGENLVRYACIMNSLYDAAGRGGLGAVMGSKNLKAVAVRGHTLPKIANPDLLKEFRKQWLDKINNHPMSGSFHEYGTGGPDIMVFETKGNVPVHNFRDGIFPGVKKIHGGIIKDKFRIGMEGCYACPVRCKKVVQVNKPYHVDAAYGGPEYETIAALGSDCGIDNLVAILKGNERCNALSLDTISTGSTIAFAMECFEKGLLTTRDTDGFALNFGDAEAMLEAVELIARRQGAGKLLAEGTSAIAKKVGKGSADFAMHVKGLETGMHEPRLKRGLGLGFMVNPNGGDHVCNIHDDGMANDIVMEPMNSLGLLETLPAEDISPRKVGLFKFEQSKQIIVDCLVMCSFVVLPVDHQMIADITGAVTGWKTSVTEQLRVAERVLTVARLFNINQGFTADDDRLPERFYQPKTNGALSKKGLEPEEMDKAKRYYYSLMGWNPDTGIPLPEKIVEMDIM